MEGEQKKKTISFQETKAPARSEACFTSPGLIKDSFFLLLHTQSHTGLY